MSRVLRFARHTAIAAAVAAALFALVAALPGDTWAQQLVRAQITNATLAVTQSGTWTVQPGNTANSTAWLVTGTGGTFPATQSGSWVVDTELPTPATLADNTANPSATALAAYMMCFDGTTWDRCQASQDASQGGAFLATGPQVMYEAINFDGTASPTTVTEGQAIRPKATTSGIAETFLVDATGTTSPQATIGSTPLIRVALFDGSNNQITAFGGSGGTASNIGSAFPTPATAAGFNDGTNMQGARVYDADIDAGTFYALWGVPCVGTTAGCSEPAYGAGANSALVQRVTLATDDEVNDNIDLIRTAAQLIDDTIFADEAAFTYATSKVSVFGAVAESTNDTLADNAVGAPVMTTNRQLRTTISADNAAAIAASACYVGSGTGSTAATNATNCANAAANFYGGWFINTSTTIGYVRFYNLGSSPTCSSATGFVYSQPIPPAAASGQAGGVVYLHDLPVNFSTGIGWCITGGGTSTDNTNGPAGIYGAIRYKL